MKTKLTETIFKSVPDAASRLFGKLACLGAVILICSSAAAQNLFVSGSACGAGENCGAIFKFTWDGRQSVFASGMYPTGDLTFDSVGNLFVTDWEPTFYNYWLIYKITPNGVWTTFASELSYPLYLAADKGGNLFVAEYNTGVVYQYNPLGSRRTFALGLYHPTGIAFDSSGNLFVADNRIGNIYQGSIYEYKPNGSRTTFAVLGPSDRPADLTFDSMGNLFMADLGGNIYKFTQQRVRTTFGAVPNSAESLAFDSSGNLFVVDAGDMNGNGNAIYKFTPQGARSTFASGQRFQQGFAHLAFQPMPCCQ